MRRCGILLPISALPSKYGIGTFGSMAYQFVDFLTLAKQSYWQILPLGPTSFGDSPYQSFCAFAGNPYFIDLDLLKEEGLLQDEDLETLKDMPLRIDYGRLYHNRFEILRKAYQRFIPTADYYDYLTNNYYWLKDYGLFMSLKTYHQAKPWYDWKACYKFYNQEVLAKYYQNNQKDVEFWFFVQYEFNKQWQALKKYAHNNQVQIIGDVPIYVALDSCDVWANSKLFLLDENLLPTEVAGCPPDAFSSEGQLWGNPLYNYQTMALDDYEWWTKRMRKASDLYDVIRIDHFRGFAGYYSINAKETTAKNGKWHKGPGIKLFKRLEAKLPNLKIIAEDLGYITEDVRKLLDETKYPGMKVLEFAFDVNDDSLYLPHNHLKNSVVYTGTHDNMPLRAWFNSLNEDEKNFVRSYLRLESDDKVCDHMIRIALASVADTTIIPFQDYLGLGLDARINTPSIQNGNWTYRIKPEYLSTSLALYIASLTQIYRRINKKEK